MDSVELYLPIVTVGRISVYSVSKPQSSIAPTTNVSWEPTTSTTAANLTRAGMGRAPTDVKNPVGSVGRPVSRVLSPARRRATVIYLAPRLPAGSSGLPGDRDGPGRSCPLLGLAPGGVCRASRSPGCWCALTLRA